MASDGLWEPVGDPAPVLAGLPAGQAEIVVNALVDAARTLGHGDDRTAAAVTVETP